MTTYYVSFTDGDDANTGQAIGQEWQNISKVNTEFAAGTFSAGDEILFKRGDTWNIGVAAERLYVKTSSGTIDNPIRIADYSTGDKPKLNLTADLFDGAIFTLHTDAGGDYILLENIEITSSGSGDRKIGILLRGVDGWIMRNLFIHDIPSTTTGKVAGIAIRQNCRWCVVDTCVIDGMDGEGVKLGDAFNLSDRTFATVVRDCTIQNCLAEGFDTKAGVTLAYVHDCTFTDNGTSATYGPHHAIVAGQYTHFYNCRFEFTGSVGSNTAAIRLGAEPEGTEYSGRYTRIERCLFKNCTGTRGAIEARGDNHQIINCTMADCKHCFYGWSHGWAGAGAIVVKNNIFTGATNEEVYLVTSQTDYTIDYNCYSDGGANIWFENGATRSIAYVQALPQEVNAVTSSADFAETTNYTLNVTSPCIDQGDSTVTQYDWNDEYAPSGAVDMGWREYDWSTYRTFSTDFTNLSRFSGTSGVTANNVMTVAMTDAANRWAQRSSLSNIYTGYFRFYIHTTGLSMANGDEFVIFEGRTSGGTAVIQVLLQYNGSNFRVRASVLDDTPTTNYTGYHNINTAGWSYVQLWWFAGRDTSTNEGFLILIVNGTQEELISGLNNHNNTIDSAYIGAVSGVDAGTVGSTIYFDNEDIDWLRELGTSEPNDPPPPAEVPTITVVTTVTITVLTES